MLNVGIIGIGNTGNQIAALGQKELKIPVLAINSSTKDLETVPDGVPSILLKNGTEAAQGAGKDRSLAKKYLKNTIADMLQTTEVTDFIRSLDILFIISSTGGGTGSGTAPVLTSIVNNMFSKVKTILIGVLPVMSEALSAQVNTVQYLNELYTSLPSQTYMLYDNDNLSSLPSYQIMEKVNSEVIKDIDVLRCKYNYTTRYDSIDEEDMKRLTSFSGRTAVSRLEDVKEKDCEIKSLEEMLISNIKSNAHVESQRDNKITATGIITNLSETVSRDFDNHIPKVRDFVGVPIHDFNHIYINEDRKMPNNVFLILSGLTPVNDKIVKINDRIDEIQEKQKIAEEENAIAAMNVEGLTESVTKNDTTKEKQGNVDIDNLFAQFGA